ncbi:hypothetical protein EYC98_02460 [Halieaceae bacterium IMCC14734]|uniref:Protein BatD n=1 Tax=Candidatus Litorirhabdus singularis TaxID=2518993 RepID=A0ABT3TBS9_9GAMM|nr:BatD family protein [Candidatus Litorirhabdus singularis]MCX2979721.1 hypothetical protein [Candidatus Litorirhabdus singularis]
MIRLLLVLLLLVWHGTATAKSLEDLLQSGELEINSWIKPNASIVVGQELELTVEIATQRWFSGGTRLKLPEAPGLIVLRRDQFANNLNRTKNGVSWVAQRWTIQLYAQREGEFNVPGIELELAVNDASAGIIRGTTRSEALSFQALLPPGLSAADRWVAAPKFSVELSTDRDLQALLPGDAFTVDILMQASNFEAMMLPVISLPEPAGLAAYPEPPELENTSNRGNAKAQRRQRITYVVEKPGQYQIEPQQLYWWDTTNSELRTLATPALSVDAGAALTPAEAAALEPASHKTRWRPNWSVLLGLLTTAGLALGIWRGLRWYQQSNTAVWQRGQRALRRGDAATAAHWFYVWLNRSRPQRNWYSLRRSVRGAQSKDKDSDNSVEHLLNAAFSDTSTELPTSLQRDRATAGKWWQRWLPNAVRLRLNPDNSAAEQKASSLP